MVTPNAEYEAWSDDESMEFAAELRRAHDPAHQLDHSYGRCALCNYTRHPCDVYDLASLLMAALNRLAPNDGSGAG